MVDFSNVKVQMSLDALFWNTFIGKAWETGIFHLNFKHGEETKHTQSEWATQSIVSFLRPNTDL